MRKQCVKLFLGLAVILWTGSNLLQAQQAPPDFVFYNGKVVTVDDVGVNDNLGTIAQALAVRGDTIIAVGSDATVRALAGPNTKSIDLKGRMITPGFAATHDHPDQWDMLNPLIVKKVVTDDVHIERFLNAPPDEQLQQFPRVLDEAVRTAKPGQWIRISMLYGKEYQWQREVSAFFGRQINKQMLDLAAPNNPTVVRGGFTGMVMNQKAIDAMMAAYGDEYGKFEKDTAPFSLSGGDYEAEVLNTGVCGTCYRYPEQDALYKTKELSEIYRLGLSWMTGYGQSMNVTNIYTAGAMAAYSALDRKEELAMRFPWVWYWPPRKDFFLDKYFVNALVAMQDYGSKYFWMGAVNPSTNLRACSTLPGTSPAVKEREARGKCAMSTETEYGRRNRLMVYNWVKAGGRFGGDHTAGDADVDFLMDVIEEASKDANISVDKMKELRHAYDHMSMSPRPDQAVRMKKLGMISGGTNLGIWEGGAESRMRDYGEQGVEQMYPRKNLQDAGVMGSVEMDRPMGYTNMTYFTSLYTGITRKDRNGKVWAPRQAVSRQIMLKSATTWGAHYAKRENVLGSLKPGFWADFVILDRDYLTIPEEEILKIRVAMTMVGGKVRHMVPSFARETGMQPTGAQVELGFETAQW